VSERSVCLHLSESDFAIVEKAAGKAGKRVGAFARDALLDQLNGDGRRELGTLGTLQVALEAVLAQGKATQRLLAQLIYHGAQGALDAEKLAELWDKHQALKQADADAVLMEAFRWSADGEKTNIP
jgi:hypothetical protein